jgi:hypothetical protein
MRYAWIVIPLLMLAANVWAMKPSGPVSITAVVTPLNEGEGLYRVEVFSHATLLGPQLNLTAFLPRDSVVVDGRSYWQGAVLYGRSLLTAFTLQLKEEQLPFQFDLVAQLERKNSWPYVTGYRVTIEHPAVKHKSTRSSRSKRRMIIEYGSP